MFSAHRVNELVSNFRPYNPLRNNTTVETSVISEELKIWVFFVLFSITYEPKQWPIQFQTDQDWVRLFFVLVTFSKQIE